MTENSVVPGNKRNIWMRGLFMLLMALALHVSGTVLGIVAVIQFVMVLLNDTPNVRLVSFGQVSGGGDGGGGGMSVSGGGSVRGADSSEVHAVRSVADVDESVMQRRVLLLLRMLLCVLWLMLIQSRQQLLHSTRGDPTRSDSEASYASRTARRGDARLDGLDDRCLWLSCALAVVCGCVVASLRLSECAEAAARARRKAIHGEPPFVCLSRSPAPLHCITLVRTESDDCIRSIRSLHSLLGSIAAQHSSVAARSFRPRGEQQHDDRATRTRRNSNAGPQWDSRNTMDGDVQTRSTPLPLFPARGPPIV